MKNTDTRIELADQLCEHLADVLEDFLEARWPRGDESELLDVGLPELDTPAPDRLIADHDTPVG
jgi:hypothetical protein